MHVVVCGHHFAKRSKLLVRNHATALRGVRRMTRGFAHSLHEKTHSQSPTSGFGLLTNRMTQAVCLEIHGDILLACTSSQCAPQSVGTL